MEPVNEEENTPVIAKKRVIIAIPGNNFSSKFLINWTNTMINLWSSNKYDIAISAGTGSFVPFVRMQTLGLDSKKDISQKPFNGDKFDIWVTIDSDILFNAEQVLELIASTEQHPVVSGMYRLEDLESFAAIKSFDTSYYAKNGNYEYMKNETIENWKSETSMKFMPVCYTGLGFFACTKEVLDKMTYPFFYGEQKNIVTDDGKVIVEMTTEDMNFCRNIQNAGFEIFLNTDLRVGHTKPIVI